MTLSEKHLSRVARDAGIAPAAAHRLLGSVRVKVSRPPVRSSEPEDAGDGAAERAADPETKVLELGLRLDSAEFRTWSLLPAWHSLLTRALDEYRRACPVIFAWVSGGDFKPQRLPERAGGAVLQHACRTAGRLRAEVMREIVSIVGS